MNRKILLLIFILLIACPVYGADTGAQDGASGISYSSTPWDDFGWTSASYVQTDDGNATSVTSNSYDTGTYTYQIKGYNYSTPFASIPTGSTIDGIEVTINCWYANGSSSVNGMWLLNTSRNSTGTNQCETPVAMSTSNATTITKGGAADKWGCELTVDWVKNANFGVAIGMIATGDNSDVYVDYAKITVYYTPPPSSPRVITIMSNVGG